MAALFLDPGRMTARLVLEAPQAVPDGHGGASLAWSVFGSAWARIEPVKAAFGEQASAGTGTVTHRVWLRFRADIVAGQRFRKGGRILLVKLVCDPDETQRFLVCHCEEAAR